MRYESLASRQLIDSLDIDIIFLAIALPYVVNEKRQKMRNAKNIQKQLYRIFTSKLISQKLVLEFHGLFFGYHVFD